MKLTTFRSFLRKAKRRITYSDFFLNALASLATLIIILLTKTLKISYYFHAEFSKLDRARVLYGFWEGRQFLLIPSFSFWNVATMTDFGWIGEIQAKIIRKFGFVPIRGSSKRKGIRALLCMKRIVQRGYPGGFALDGPSGPIYKSKPGILFLAQKLGYPIVPVTASADRAWVFKNTWCRYFLPKPFSRCYVAVGKPLWKATIKGKLTSDELDHILVEWMAEADRRVKENSRVDSDRR